ncbi:MAG TPA: MFS transporter [Rhodocyclaceae bacterium]|nr:MFS transporter [Rhodocyclaceae bacterium]
MRNIKGLRWWIIALICLGTIINYLARNSLGVMAPELMKTLNFTTQQYSYVVAAFQLAYTVMQPVCGYIIDFLGLKVGFALFAVLWSVSSILHSAANSWQGLAFFRGLLGLNEAAAIPSGIKAVGEWFPAKERSVAVGWFNAGTSLGAMLAPPLIIFVALQSSWRWAFVVPGVMGLVWAVMWYCWYRSPKEHLAISDEEREYILSGQVATPAGVKPALKDIVFTREFWAIALPRFLAEPAWQTFSFWIPLYLATERGMDIKQIALFAWLPFLTADLGGILGGYLSPFFMKHFHFQLINSRIAGVVIGAVCMIGPGCIGLVSSPYSAIALFCLGGFAHQMISALLNTLSTDVFKPHELATANGLTGMVSWIGGLSFSLIVGALATKIGYNPLFVCLSIFDILGAIIVVSVLRNRQSVNG